MSPFAGIRKAHAPWQHHNLGTDQRTLIKADCVLVDIANAAGRDILADRPRFDRAMGRHLRVIGLPSGGLLINFSDPR